MRVAVDTSILIGLANPQDIWHSRSRALHDALLASNSQLFYFDCAVAEAVSTLSRRLAEKKRTAEVKTLIEEVRRLTPQESITWIFADVARLYEQVLALVELTAGSLNFNDALISLVCRERNIPDIASFDSDFDQIDWLHRIARPEDVVPDSSQ